MRGQEDVRRRHRRGPRDQLGEALLFKVARQKQMAPGAGDVEHQAAGVIRGLGVPAGGGVQHGELDAGILPGLGRRERSQRDAARSDLL